MDETLWLLFAATGSAVVALTVALLTIGLGPAYVAGTSYVAVSVMLAPIAIFPSVQGKPPAHGAVTETNVRPAGVGSARETPMASSGPALITVIVYDTLAPGTALAGPVLLTERSALGAMTGVVTDAVLSAAFGSAVGELTVAVLTIGFAPA
jgi:hypothetical protein